MKVLLRQGNEQEHELNSIKEISNFIIYFPEVNSQRRFQGLQHLSINTVIHQGFKGRAIHKMLENIAKERKVIPDPIDDRKFQE